LDTWFKELDPMDSILQTELIKPTRGWVSIKAEAILVLPAVLVKPEDAEVMDFIACVTGNYSSLRIPEKYSFVAES
jgi:hypothetical protein